MCGPGKQGSIPSVGIKTQRTRLMLSLSQIRKPGGKLPLCKGTLINNARLYMNPVLYQKEREDAMINSHVDICCMFYM